MASSVSSDPKKLEFSEYQMNGLEWIPRLVESIAALRGNPNPKPIRAL